ncbi:hypothetical protein [Neorhizobium galegae]|uniref:hypothetical protein n=1 Tax=Neorhizobium galegae TaxID=399 RepID=UPI0027D90B16|nr:hypothetical protein [Neorhizobium galegae]
MQLIGRNDGEAGLRDAVRLSADRRSRRLRAASVTATSWRTDYGLRASYVPISSCTTRRPGPGLILA